MAQKNDISFSTESCSQKKLLILASGNGTNFQAIINAIDAKIIDAEISCLICNNLNVGAMNIAQNHNIKSIYHKFSGENRIKYDIELAKIINNFGVDLIVCAGWMHVLSAEFLNEIGNTKIINLHPALPNQFHGKNAIEKAFAAFENGIIDKTGIMVHYVDAGIDTGKPILSREIPINKNDTLISLTNRVKYYEKDVLINAINIVLGEKKSYPLIYRGKVRDVYDLNYNLLAFVQSDRQSAFDRHICNIDGKGIILTKSSEWWFDKTKHIIPNHFLASKDNIMICKKATPYKIEMVVRGYITGSTSTSLWTHYKNGVREYCGKIFPDGLQKNQKLSTPVVTPTTKGDIDELITPREIIERGFMTQEEWEYLEHISLKLFKYGQKIAKSRGLILVDTKYEFGYDSCGNIMLIDEIHTCDSSRYWIENTYQSRFNEGLEPEKLDKDIVREFIAKKCDPYKDELPEIPEEIINTAISSYTKFYSLLIQKEVNIEINNEIIDKKLVGVVENYLNNVHNTKAIIFAGSERDGEWINNIAGELKKCGIYSQIHISSAHKNTRDVIEFIEKNEIFDGKIVNICVAGMSNALGGVVSANSRFPTINCPPFKDKIDLATNINSSIQNPSNVPAMLILSPANVALATKKILEL